MNIAALGILWIDDSTIPDSNAFLENPHAVSVQMHRMNNWEIVVEHNSNRSTGAEIIHIPFRIIRIGVIAGFCEK